MSRSPKKRPIVGAASMAPALVGARSNLNDAAREVSRLAATKGSEATKPLDIALSSSEVLDLLAAKIVAVGAQPEVYYIPTSSLLAWVVFRFKPMLPPATFRVSVDVGDQTVKTIEDPYIADRPF